MQVIGNLTLFDSIDNLPQFRRHLFEKMEMIRKGVGGSMEDIENAYRKLDTFIQAKDYDKLLVERSNLHMRHFNALTGLDFKSASFICLIEKIGKEVIIIDKEDDINNYIDTVSKITPSKAMDDYILDVKKKFLQSLGYTFQTDSESAKN